MLMASKVIKQPNRNKNIPKPKKVSKEWFVICAMSKGTPPVIRYLTWYDGVNLSGYHFSLNLAGAQLFSKEKTISKVLDSLNERISAIHQLFYSRRVKVKEERNSNFNTLVFVEDEIADSMEFLGRL